MRLSSTFSPAYIAVLASVTLLATSPAPAVAGDCTLECTKLSAKILSCGNLLRDGITDRLPTIGVSAEVDNCLCDQDTVRYLRSCEGCRDLNNAVNKTEKFISDCKILTPSRVLVNGAPSLGSAPSAAISAVVLALSIGISTLLA